MKFKSNPFFVLTLIVSFLIFSIVIFFNILRYFNPTEDDMLKAFKDDDAGVMTRYIRIHPEKLTYKTRNDISILNGAIIQNKVNIIKVFLRYKANIHNYNNNGLTPISYAIYNDNIAVVLLLLNAGFREDEPCTKAGDLPLIYAAKVGSFNSIRLLLSREQKQQSKEKLQEQLNIALLSASSCLRIHNEFRRDNANKDKPKIELIEHHYCKIAELLLDNGADPNYINDSAMNQTVIFNAILSKRLPMVEMLVSHGAKVNIKDAIGNSPLSWAEVFGDKNIADFLKKHGAKGVNGKLHHL